MRMVDAVAGAVQRNPDILRAAVRLAEAVDDGLGNAAIARERFGIAAEADHLIGRARAALEDETRDEQMPAADAQVRLAGDEDLALGLRSERDRLGGGAGPREDDLEIAPFAVGKDDRVASSEERRVGKECVGTCRSRGSTHS